MPARRARTGARRENCLTASLTLSVDGRLSCPCAIARQSPQLTCLPAPGPYNTVACLLLSHVTLLLACPLPHAQVIPCGKAFPHDWSACPFAHPTEAARRRDPRVHPHTGVSCPRLKKVRPAPASGPQSPVGCPGGSRCLPGGCLASRRLHRPLPPLQEGRCELGDACPYAHSIFEYWLHPSRRAWVAAPAAAPAAPHPPVGTARARTGHQPWPTSRTMPGQPVAPLCGSRAWPPRSGLGAPAPAWTGLSVAWRAPTAARPLPMQVPHAALQRRRRLQALAVLLRTQVGVRLGHGQQACGWRARPGRRSATATQAPAASASPVPTNPPVCISSSNHQALQTPQLNAFLPNL